MRVTKLLRLCHIKKNINYLAFLNNLMQIFVFIPYHYLSFEGEYIIL